MVPLKNIKYSPLGGLNKSKLFVKTMVIVALIIMAILTVGIVGYCLLNWTEKDKTSDVNKYEQYLGANGSHSGITMIESDIFPTSIPKTAKVENFMYYYYNPWDPCFCVSLVYTCSDEDYIKEIKRLQSINSSSDYNVYGLTGFSDTLCAVNVDAYNGIIYALTQESENRIIYVEITACNYFNDIDYEKLIDKKYLPVGFDMTYNNPTQRKEK